MHSRTPPSLLFTSIVPSLTAAEDTAPPDLSVPDGKENYSPAVGFHCGNWTLLTTLSLRDVLIIEGYLYYSHVQELLYTCSTPPRAQYQRGCLLPHISLDIKRLLFIRFRFPFPILNLQECSFCHHRRPHLLICNNQSICVADNPVKQHGTPSVQPSRGLCSSANGEQLHLRQTKACVKTPIIFSWGNTGTEHRPLKTPFQWV